MTSNEISHNITQTSQGIQQVNKNVYKSSVVSSDIAKDIDAVNQEVISMSSGSSKVNQNAEALSKLADHLNEMLGWFKV